MHSVEIPLLKQYLGELILDTMSLHISANSAVYLLLFSVNIVLPVFLYTLLDHMCTLEHGLWVLYFQHFGITCVLDTHFEPLRS